MLQHLNAENVTYDTHAESDALATRLGAHLLEGGTSTRFRIWTTLAQEVGVKVDGTTYPMQAQGNGIYETILPVQAGARYFFVLDGILRPDPYARFLPDGVHGAAEVVDLHAYQWQNTDWRGLRLRDCIFYELHIGTFTPEGTYHAAQEKLPYLKELGITAIQLMPLAAFSGRRGWGYDSVSLYAPYSPYGSPTDLMAFIDAAHGLGIGVFLDVVYNHFGPDGNYLPCYAPTYFTDRFSSDWGAGVDYAEPHMRRYITGNARMWLRDYHFDGLRLDATQAMQDDSPVHILRELANEVHKLRGTHLLLAEDSRNLPELITADKLDGIWADDFHHEMRVTLTAEQDGYYRPFRGGAAALAQVIQKGWTFDGQWWPLDDAPRGKPADALSAENFVFFIQNHDQIGNRPAGDRLHQYGSMTLPRFRGASLLLLTLPMTPLIFMGQEWAADSPFPFFSDHHGELGKAVSEGRKKEFGGFASFHGDEVLDPQAEETYRLAHLDWAEQERGAHAQTLSLYRELIRLRQTDPVLRNRDRAKLQAGSIGNDLLWVRTQTDAGERVVLWNLSAADLKLDTLPLPFELPDGVLLESEAVPPASHTRREQQKSLHSGHAILLGRDA